MGEVRSTAGVSRMDELWESTLGKLRGRLADETYVTWLEPIRFDGIEGRVVRLRIPNRFFADWISARYLPDILDSLASLTGESGLDVEWVVDASLQAAVSSAGGLEALDTRTALETSTGDLRAPRLTLDRRVTARASRLPGRAQRDRAGRAAGELFEATASAPAASVPRPAP